MGFASKRDENNIPAVFGVSSIDLKTPTAIKVNPSTGAMFIDSASLYVGLDPRYVEKTGDTMSGELDISLSVAGSVAQFGAINTATSGASYSVFYAQVESTSTADPMFQFSINGITDWVMGADNSDSDKFKISTSTTLGTNDRFIIDTSGNIILPIGVIAPSVDSAAAIQFKNAALTQVLLSLDTTNTRLGIGTAIPNGRFHAAAITVGEDVHVYIGSTGANKSVFDIHADTTNDNGWIETYKTGVQANDIFIRAKNIFLDGGQNFSYSLICQADDRVYIGNGNGTNATAWLHIQAGSASASSAPFKLTSGTLMTTAEAAAVEYNGNHYKTQGGGVRFSIGGTLFDHYADAASSSTNGTFDDLYSDTIATNTFNTNGDKITAEYGGVFVASGTATRDIKVLFAGTTILDTSTLTTATADSWDIRVFIIRESSTVVRCQTSIVASTTLGTQAFNDTTYTRITGLTLSGTNILKIQGAAAGVGAAASDIVAKLGTIHFSPAI